MLNHFIYDLKDIIRTPLIKQIKMKNHISGTPTSFLF